MRHHTSFSSVPYNTNSSNSSYLARGGNSAPSTPYPINNSNPAVGGYAPSTPYTTDCSDPTREKITIGYASCGCMVIVTFYELCNHIKIERLYCPDHFPEVLGAWVEKTVQFSNTQMMEILQILMEHSNRFFEMTKEYLPVILPPKPGRSCSGELYRLGGKCLGDGDLIYTRGSFQSINRARDKFGASDTLLCFVGDTEPHKYLLKKEKGLTVW